MARGSTGIAGGGKFLIYSGRICAAERALSRSPGFVTSELPGEYPPPGGGGERRAHSADCRRNGWRDGGFAVSFPRRDSRASHARNGAGGIRFSRVRAARPENDTQNYSHIGRSAPASPLTDRQSFIPLLAPNGNNYGLFIVRAVSEGGGSNLGG